MKEIENFYDKCSLIKDIIKNTVKYNDIQYMPSNRDNDLESQAIESNMDNLCDYFSYFFKKRYNIFCLLEMNLEN